jgi:hypothetical protein
LVDVVVISWKRGTGIDAVVTLPAGLLSARHPAESRAV